MSETPALEARELSRRYGRRWAVRRVSAAFVPGSVSAVVGHNGAGKSTLLGLLAGTIRATEGSLRAFGEEIGDPATSPILRRGLGLLGHQPFLYPDLTGRENLRFMAKLYGRRRRSGEVQELLERVGLKLAADRAARTYSRGMVQRLALARIMVQDADIWLLDEPTTGLDTAGRELFREIVSRGREQGRAIVLVTHDLESVRPLLDRVLTLESGRLLPE